MSRVSVLIPALNEQATLARVVDAAWRTGLVHEMIVIDDGSTDATPHVLRDLHARHGDRLRSARHPHPRGKGAAVRTGLRLARGGIILIQDADLEYRPDDYPNLLAPFADPQVQVVYGSRCRQRGNPRSSFSFYWGGRLLSWSTNLLFGAGVTDESTGFKAVRASLLRELDLQLDGFAFCPELTGRLLRRGVTIHEVPITYRPRTLAEGKKVRWRDGLIALGVLVQERLRAPATGGRRGSIDAAAAALAPGAARPGP